MRKIDIEKWERKTPDLPENFFDEMQKNVLEKTICYKELKRFSISWVWSSVAAVVVIVGLMFFIQQNQKEKIEFSQGLSYENTEIKHLEESEIDKKLVLDVEEKPIVSEKVSFANQKVEIKPKLTPTEIKTKEKIEVMLNEMSEEDFVDLAVNYEQDVYLELF